MLGDDSPHPSTSSNTNVIANMRAAQSIKAPPFCADKPAIWFAQLEAQFSIHNITDEKDKFSLAIAHIATQHAAEVEDIFISPPASTPYSTMKTALLERYSKSKEAKLQQLLQGESMGNRSPSSIWRHLKSLVPSISQDVLRAKWCSALPEQTRILLTTQSNTSLEQQGALADKLHELLLKDNCISAVTAITTISSNRMNERIERLSAQLNALMKSLQQDNTRRSRSRSRHRANFQTRPTHTPQFSTNGHCYYHSIYHDKAQK